MRDLGQECADFREAYLAAVARAKTAIAGGSDATMSALSTALDKVAALATDAWPTDLHDQLKIAAAWSTTGHATCCRGWSRWSTARADRAPAEAKEIRDALATGRPAERLSAPLRPGRAHRQGCDPERRRRACRRRPGAAPAEPTATQVTLPRLRPPRSWRS